MVSIGLLKCLFSKPWLRALFYSSNHGMKLLVLCFMSFWLKSDLSRVGLQVILRYQWCASVKQNELFCHCNAMFWIRCLPPFFFFYKNTKSKKKHPAYVLFLHAFKRMCWHIIFGYNWLCFFKVLWKLHTIKIKRIRYADEYIEWKMTFQKLFLIA